MSYTTETLGMTVVEEGEAADLRTVSDALDKIDAFAGDIATVEESPSVAAHDKGELLVYAGHLYKVTAAIAIGDSLTLGTNVTPANVGTELSTLRTDVDTLQDSVSLSSYTVHAGVTARRFGKVVTVYGNWANITSIGTAVGTDYSFGILPEGLRPAYYALAPITLGGDVAGRVLIGINGDVVYRLYRQITNADFTVTFVAA